MIIKGPPGALRGPLPGRAGGLDVFFLSAIRLVRLRRGGAVRRGGALARALHGLYGFAEAQPKAQPYKPLSQSANQIRIALMVHARVLRIGGAGRRVLGFNKKSHPLLTEIPFPL